MSDILLQDEIADIMAKEIAKEIDFEILSGMLIGTGWTKVVLSPMTGERGADIDEWTKYNLKGKFNTLGLVWIFEHQSDANWFAMRWAA